MTILGYILLRKVQGVINLKAIIFDMDGVIINSEPLHFKLERELLEELGGSIDRDEHESFVGTTDVNMWSAFKDKFNLKPTVDEMVEMKRNRFMENIPNLELIPNFFEFMMEVYDRGYKIALASSNNKKAVDKIVETFELEKYFDFIINGEEVENGKPDPEIFLAVSNNLKLEPKDCLVIEDAKNGVAAAKDAGMKCIGLKSKGSGDQNLSRADLVIEDFNEINLQIITALFK